MNEVFRQEKKYLLSLDQYYKLSQKLPKILAQDKNNQGEGYGIRSLYFDSIDDKDFEDKVSGVELRRKIRLRTYLQEKDMAVLEMKQKQGELQKKRSLIVSKEDAMEIIGKNYSVLLKYKDDLATECYGLMNTMCYLPKTVVDYQRKAFVAQGNNIRITLDHNIRATESNFNIFDEIDKEKVIKEILKKQNIDEKVYPVGLMSENGLSTDPGTSTAKLLKLLNILILI